MEATRTAKKGFKASVPEAPSGSSVQESLSSAQEAASSAISSLTEGDAATHHHIKHMELVRAACCRTEP